MWKRVLVGFVCMVAGYFIGLFGCLLLLPYLTSNAHDAGVEAAMTGAFVIGPIVALVGGILGAVLAKPHRVQSARN
jgi:hypothetical protein